MEKKIILPSLINNNNKIPFIALAIGIFISLYSITGRFQIGTPRWLSLLEFEESIPLHVDSIWLYIAMYPFLIWSAFTYKTKNLNQMLYAFILTVVMSSFVFVLIPVGYPREFFPLPISNDISTLVFTLIRALDSPLNCFPSLHVSLCYLFAFGHFEESKKKFALSVLLASLISYSTLTTKQHYFVDVLGGLFMAIINYLLIKKLTTLEDA